VHGNISSDNVGIFSLALNDLVVAKLCNFACFDDLCGFERYLLVFSIS